VITALVTINCVKAAVSEVAEHLIEVDGVYEVYSVTGDFDLIAILRLAEFDRVADVVAGNTARLPNIINTRTHVAFRAYSRIDLEAMFSIGTS
jgi:DNA-binding Lrp family transcriptional regulator